MFMTKPKGIVLELQRDCLDQTVSASTILRKAKVIASKLGLNELEQWLTSELEGYDCSLDELPDHRKGIGQPKFRNPYHGWCPIMTDDGWFGQAVRTVFLKQSVSEMEELIEGESSSLVMYYNPAIQEALQRQLPVPMECALHFSKSQVVHALDYIRNKTLNWTLELEKRGILGEGLSFGEAQKQEAQLVTNHIYGGNVGVLGSVSGDANNTGFIASGGDMSVGSLSKLVIQIREALPALPPEARQSMEHPLTNLETELSSPKPSKGRVAELMTSMRTILEGATGNLAASGILAAIAAAVG